MKKLSSISRLLTLIVAASLIFSSCKKEYSDTLTAKEEEEAANEASISETETEFAFNDVFDNVMGVNAEVGIGGVGVFGRIMTNGRLLQPDSIRCFTVTVTPQPTGFPKTVVIDFGNGCNSQGVNRSGKIITVYTGRLIHPGSSATTTFENYKINGLSITGTHVITNTTATVSGSNLRQFTVEVTNAKIIRPNGTYIQWDSKRVSTQVEGNGTLLPADDIFSIRGSAKGKVKTLDHLFQWNSEITEPLVKKFICHWISKGIIKVTRETLSANSPWVSVLNYGNGDCDNKATITINGNTRQISLH